jgi:hypothetical protein
MNRQGAKDAKRNGEASAPAASAGAEERTLGDLGALAVQQFVNSALSLR